jgi:hypothetical protein
VFLRFFLLVYLDFFWFLVVLEFEHQASCLQDSCFISWATPPALFVLVTLEIGSYFFPGQSGPGLSYFRHSVIARMTGTCHHTQLFPLWGKVLQIFCPGYFIESQSSWFQPPT